MYKFNKKLIKLLKGDISVSDYYNSNKESSPPEEDITFECNVCMTNKIDILYYPCKHAICCNECYKILKSKKMGNDCQKCRGKIDYVLDFII
jgi:hypothetical protein